MSANLASGGRVWKFNAGQINKANPPRFLEVWGFALWFGLPAGILVSLPGILLLLNGIETTGEPAKSIAGGWGKADFQDNLPTILFTFGIVAVFMIGLSVSLAKLVIYKRALITTLILMVVPAILTSVLVGSSITESLGERKDAFNDWAQNTYGYTINGNGKVEGSIVVYNATDKDGRNIKVKSFIEQDNTYLYETLPQMNEIMGRIIAETEGKS